MKTVTRAKGWIAAQVKSVLKSVNAQTADGAGNIALTTDNVPEGPTNKYFTAAGVLAAVLTGLDVTLAGAVVATDTILAAFGKLQKQLNAWIALKDASGGFAGLTLFQINFRNAANTFTSFFTNANTAARTYTFPDKDGTVAMLTDLAAGAASSGNWVLLSKTTIAAGTGLANFLNSFTGSYDKYVVLLENIQLSVADFLWLQAATGGAANTNSVYYQLPLNAAGISTSGAALSIGASGTVFTSMSGCLEFENAPSTTAGKPIVVSTVRINGSTISSDFSRHFASMGSALTGFRFYGGTTATFNGGTVLIYGIKNT